MKSILFKSGLIFLIITGFNCITLFGQTITVTGKVTDATDNSELIGVSITLDGTNTGTLTGIDGTYSIQAKIGDKLEFSYIGYLKTTIIVKNTVHNVALRPDLQTIDEVVVVGYGTRKKKDVTSACQAISGKQRQYPASPQASPAFSHYSINYDAMDTEDYKDFAENRFRSATEEPLSTFSIDVDAASYSNVRRMINQGQKPTPDAVRIEELINYFSYDYPQPTGKDPVKITTEAGECPWNKNHRLVRIGLKAKEIASENLPASNLVFLIDVSGSMDGPTRLELVKSSLKLLINNLREKDKVAIVVYAGSAGEVLPSTPGNDKQKIREALDHLQAGGSTAGGEGIKLAYKIAGKNFIKGGNNRIILCTDGDFNVGVSSNEELEKLIESERKSSGVFLTILGYGMGNYKDSKMQVLAEKGNGNHAYIDNLQEANKVLVNEFGGTIYTVAKDVKLQIEFNPVKVQYYRLVGYESRLLNKEDFNDDTKDAGEMGAGHTVTAFYEVVPVGVQSNITGGVDKLKYQEEKSGKSPVINNSPDLLTVKLRYKEPDKNTSEKIEQAVIDKGGNNVSSDFKFAASVAMFGQLLKNSDFKGNATYDNVISLAQKGLDNDTRGYRREFIRLAETVKGME